MKRVAIWYHRDGDRLAVVEVPWWLSAYEWLLHLICPCHGVCSWMFDKLGENAQDWYYSRWTNLHRISDKKEKTLYETPIESGCLASQQIWPKNKAACWRDDCEYCWDLREDAYNEMGRTQNAT